MPITLPSPLAMAMFVVGRNTALRTGSVLNVIRTKTTFVRVIAIEDLPSGKAYKGDVLEVKAGYARNYLIPNKIVYYATHENFARLNMPYVDPKVTKEKKEQARLSIAGDDEDADLKAADILKYYLRNKVLKIKRNIDPITMLAHPGHVSAKHIRQKLSKQLKIDLEPHEIVHLREAPFLGTELEEENPLEKAIQGMGDPEIPCTTEVRKLGDYIARITLRGGFQVPLRVEVIKR